MLLSSSQVSAYLSTHGVWQTASWQVTVHA